VTNFKSSRRSQLWVEDDERLLHELLTQKASKTLIAAKLKRSWIAIRKHGYSLGLAMGPRVKRAEKQ
jgi:hypothetical protein